MSNCLLIVFHHSKYILPNIKNNFRQCTNWFSVIARFKNNWKLMKYSTHFGKIYINCMEKWQTIFVVVLINGFNVETTPFVQKQKPYHQNSFYYNLIFRVGKNKLPNNGTSFHLSKKWKNAFEKPGKPIHVQDQSFQKNFYIIRCLCICIQTPSWGG